MKNSERFYNNICGFVDDMAEVVAKYDATVKRLEPYKGSSGYNSQIREAEDTKNAAVMALRERYWGRFQTVVNDMRTAVQTRPIVAPTAEQSAILSVMQMRKTLSRDELGRAARQLAGCPFGLAVLDDLAEKHHIMGSPFNTERDSDLLDRIDTLARSALRLIQEDVNAANRRKPETVTDCIERFGSFSRIPTPEALRSGTVTSADLQPNMAAISEFCAAVDWE